MQLKKLYLAINILKKKILGEQRDKDINKDGERNSQTVGILVKGRPGSASGVAGGAEVRCGRRRREVEAPVGGSQRVCLFIKFSLACC